MRDTHPGKPFDVECGTLNFDVQARKGTHWTCCS